MILYGGKIYESSEQDRLLNALEQRIPIILAQESLCPDTVIRAAESLARDIDNGVFDEELSAAAEIAPIDIKAQAALLLSRESLEYKLKTELCGEPADYRTAPPAGFAPIRKKAMPLGVVFHIAAGNMDGLPAYTLAEGLLAGNINILKLPQADNGISLKIISKLIEYEPQLADFIYVFDTPSADIRAMQRMADLADGICVWGGDEAVSAVRALAPTGAKLIEWGHKLGFCYISGYESKERELTALAEHLAVTRGMLCSSCQTIFIDTNSLTQAEEFCAEFLPYMERAFMAHAPTDIGTRARNTLIGLTERLEGWLNESPADSEYIAKCCRIVLKSDSALELAPLSGSVLVKPLAHNRLCEELRRSKGYLQTAGLICAPSERSRLTELLMRCGVTRITHAGNMSAYFCGESHDGQYPLRRFMRTVDIEE
ncbi:MAG: acyl-CoA reductase [Oscillospiraceae bacterium]